MSTIVTRNAPDLPGVARQRLPSHLLVAASSWASRLVSAAVQLVSVRLLLQALGLVDYSAFALLTGLQGWFLLADLGVGISVQNHISEARARGEPTGGLLVTARLLAVLLLLATLALLYFASPMLAPLLLKAYPDMSEARKVQTFFIAGALSIGFGVGGIVYKVWYAEQRGYLSNVVPAVAAVIGLAGVAVAGRIDPDWRLAWCLLAFVGPTAALPLGILGVQLLRGGLRADAPLRFGEVCRRAGGFLAFAILGAVTLQVDYIVLSQRLTARDIATYSLMTKVFGLVFFVYSALILALWPTFTELIVQRRWPEVVAYLRRYVGLGVGFVAGCTLALLWAMPLAIGLLAGGQGIVASTALILVMGTYWVVRVWTDTFSMLLQSMNRVRPVLLLVPLQALLSGALQWVLAPRLGLVGTVLGLICSFALTVSWGLPLAAFREFRSATARTP